MRDILFRAKRIDNGEWVYGYYIKTHDYLDNREIHLIVGIDSTSFPANEITDTNEIDPETLGEFTGLIDKKNVRIFEGDVIQCELAVGTVAYQTGADDNFLTGFIVLWTSERYLRQELGFWATQRDITVISNIYDNPELLEDKK